MKKYTKLLALILALTMVVALMTSCVGIDNETGIDGESQSQTDEHSVSGEDYESAVWQVFWESASKVFGIEYSDYKTAHTAYDYICDYTTSDGYTAHYYLIRTAYETKNVFGEKVLHNVTARCYCVPEYSKTVYTTYLTLDGETLIFDEETENWLMNIGNGKNPYETEDSEAETSFDESTSDTPETEAVSDETTTDSPETEAASDETTTDVPETETSNAGVETSETLQTDTTENITSTYVSTEDMNVFLFTYILPKYVSLNGKLHNTVEYDSNEETEWCYKLTGQVGMDSYEAMVYPFQLGKGNEITDLWIAYLCWNEEMLIQNDYSEQIDYIPKKYW